MTLKEFREKTKDLPDDATLWVLNTSGAWQQPEVIKTREERLLFAGGQNIPDNLKSQVEVRLDFN